MVAHACGSRDWWAEARGSQVLGDSAEKKRQKKKKNE